MIETRVENHIGYVSLTRAPMNLMDIPFMQAFAEAHRDLEKNSEVWGVIVHSTVDGYFSNGLDPAMMLSRDTQGRAEVFEVLLKMVLEVYAFSKPHISAIEGHAMAGGAVLAILSDWRFMSREKSRISFSEVAVGLTIPKAIINLIESATGPGSLREIAMLGSAIKSTDAVRMGLIDEVFDNGTTLKEAERYLKRVFELPLASVRSVKQILRANNLAALKGREGLETLSSFVGAESFVEGLSAVRDKRRPKYKNP
ncbi:enoyl-CoA hydratase/isomerase family protein [Turneriella parva]|uniref:Enoyl-CoA hydratase/isomerase n=1 Tax=Turneriella parva (strain ATCC BAA-1111 / DSM 21527 / NCTC 11395 / H) TaxID=869212 RepID=I4B6S0_TURPD|nr:enoyl-CoA hydratase/isomerase family protein [Turneriella parva]AFM12977.1 Enoyl-CoA hydratase/isomerase [Turneriella parva DSM 21527]